jgi:glutathione S-transferase
MNPNGLVPTIPDGDWQLLDHELSRRKYAAGDQLTLADIAFGSSIHRWFALPIERPNFVHLKAWHDRIAVRPGFREHIAKPLV